MWIFLKNNVVQHETSPDWLTGIFTLCRHCRVELHQHNSTRHLISKMLQLQCDFKCPYNTQHKSFYISRKQLYNQSYQRRSIALARASYCFTPTHTCPSNISITDFPRRVNFFNSLAAGIVKDFRERKFFSSRISSCHRKEKDGLSRIHCRRLPRVATSECWLRQIHPSFRSRENSRIFKKF
jgi:hypothetical protein